MSFKRLSTILALSIFSFALFLTSCEPDEEAKKPVTVFKISPTGDYNNELATIMSDVVNGVVKTPIKIEFEAGTYTLTQSFTFSGVDGLYIKGAGRELTILDFDFNVGNGFPINDSFNIVLCDFTAKNTSTSIFEMRKNTNVRFNNVGAIWDTQSSNSGPYGLYPTTCINVIIENCYAKNAIDAGIYSGQNRNVIIRNNVSEGNVFGFEVENSINTIVTGNTFRNNSNGGLIYDLAGLGQNINEGQFGIVDGVNILFENNLIENNNLNNFAAANGGGGFVGNAPVGVGLVLAANNKLEIRNNTFKNNNLLGIAQVTYFLVDLGDPGNNVPSYADRVLTEDPGVNPNFGVFNSGISIHDNTFTFDVANQNLAAAELTQSGQFILLTYDAAGISPTNPVHYIIESQDYSSLIPGLKGERPYLGQTGEKVIESNYLALDPMTGEGIVTTSTNLADFANPLVGFRNFDLPNPPACN